MVTFRLLFISYKFVKGFLAITFNYLLFLAETFIVCVNVFYITRKEISVGSDQSWGISPYTPIIKIAHFCNVMSMGTIFVFCRIQLKFRFWLCKKPWQTSWQVQLEITSNKKVIAKNPLTNLYEMNSSCVEIEGTQCTTVLPSWNSYVSFFFASQYENIAQPVLCEVLNL